VEVSIPDVVDRPPCNNDTLPKPWPIESYSYDAVQGICALGYRRRDGGVSDDAIVYTIGHGHIYQSKRDPSAVVYESGLAVIVLNPFTGVVITGYPRNRAGRRYQV
jgi:hypothetical protein